MHAQGFHVTTTPPMMLLFKNPCENLEKMMKKILPSPSPGAFVFVLLTLMYASSIYAYRTDHGLLPPGANVCANHVPVTLNVPPLAQAIPDPLQGEFSHGFYHIEELNDGLYYITDGVYQTMFLVGQQGIILVDAPPSIGINNADPSQSITLVEAIYSIDATQGKAIKALIYSHSHIDHIGAASLVKNAFPKLQIIAHKETREQIKRGTGESEGILPGAGTYPPPLPTRVFTTKHHVNVGAKQKLMLAYKGATHEPGNIYIYAPHQKVLTLIDVVFPKWSPFSNLAVAKSAREYIDSYDKVLAYDFDIFIGGHFNRLGTRADVEEAKMYIHDIKANAFAALQKPELFAIFGQAPQNGLGAFPIYLDQVACDCANTTLNPATTPSGSDWLNQIGNASIGTLTHCWSMAEAIRIEADF